MKSVIAKPDKTSKGKRQRYTVGNIDSPISGALYIKPSVELPVEITVVFPLKKKKEVAK
ncbi:MAG: hypothetical protein ACTSPB_05580 [Candidatus Thorarchaeota archaeon]